MHIITDSAVQIMSNEVDDHKIFCHLFDTTSESLRCKGTGHAGRLAHCAFDRTQLADGIGRARE
jgi:hypothetical protein